MRFWVVGAKYYLENGGLKELHEKYTSSDMHEDDLTLEPEPDNPHDSNAVVVKYHGEKIGHVPRNILECGSEDCTFVAVEWWLNDNPRGICPECDGNVFPRKDFNIEVLECLDEYEAKIHVLDVDYTKARLLLHITW